MPSAVAPLRLIESRLFEPLRESQVNRSHAPLIANTTVFHHARHEVWTPMLVSRDEKQNE